MLDDGRSSEAAESGSELEVLLQLAAFATESSMAAALLDNGRSSEAAESGSELEVLQLAVPLHLAVFNTE